MTLRARRPRLVLERKCHALRALRPEPPPTPPLPRSILYGHESPVHAQGHTALVIYVSEMYLIRYFSEFDTTAGTRIIQVKCLAQGHLNRGRLDYSLLVVLGFFLPINPLRSLLQVCIAVNVRFLGKELLPLFRSVGE